MFSFGPGTFWTYFPHFLCEDALLQFGEVCTVDASVALPRRLHVETWTLLQRAPSDLTRLCLPQQPTVLHPQGLGSGWVTGSLVGVYG